MESFILWDCLVWSTMSFFSFSVKQPNGRKSQPPVNFLKFALMSGPTVKLEKRYAMVNYCSRL